MIEMRCDDAEAQSLAKVEQRAGKRDGIRTAGKPDENRRASTQPRSRERRLDRAYYFLFSVANHRCEITLTPLPSGEVALQARVRAFVSSSILHPHLPKDLNIVRRPVNLRSNSLAPHLTDGRQYLCHHKFGTTQDLLIPEPQNPKPLLAQEPAPRRIRSFLLSMLSAVQLNNQPTIEAAEVRDIISYRHLSPELHADQGSISENTPELALRISHFSPHPARTIENYRISRRFRPHRSNIPLPSERSRLRHG